jgi:hypothetical protein
MMPPGFRFAPKEQSAVG